MNVIQETTGERYGGVFYARTIKGCSQEELFLRITLDRKREHLGDAFIEYKGEGFEITNQKILACWNMDTWYVFCFSETNHVVVCSGVVEESFEWAKEKIRKFPNFFHDEIEKIRIKKEKKEKEEIEKIRIEKEKEKKEEIEEKEFFEKFASEEAKLFEKKHGTEKKATLEMFKALNEKKEVFFYVEYREKMEYYERLEHADVTLNILGIHSTLLEWNVDDYDDKQEFLEFLEILKSLGLKKM